MDKAQPEKECAVCGANKPLSDFPKHGERWRTKCGPCYRAYLKELLAGEPIVCACGCGTRFTPSTRGVRYKKGHYNRGRSFSESHCKKIRDSLRGINCSEEQVRRMKERNRRMAARARQLSQEQRLEMTKVGREVLQGSHGFGKTARDNPRHCQAKAWIIQSPAGEQYQLTNLVSWCRKHEHLFEDPNPGSKKPLHARASCKLTDFKKWNGWIVISCRELG